MTSRAAITSHLLCSAPGPSFSCLLAGRRRRSPATRVEVLISDCKGDPAALQAIFDARPDVLNHNVETVPRLQRAVRPSAGVR